ncbi:hypothetical protein H8959_004340 [Pygathrix nigripes]
MNLCQQILHCVKEEHLFVKRTSMVSVPCLLEQSPVPEPLPQPDFDDKGENLENIEPLQVSFAVLSSPNKSSISETLSGSTDTFSSSNNHEKIPSHKVGRITRTSNRRNQLVSFVEENVCNLLNTEVQPCKEKKSNRRKSQETKCTKRTLPKKNQIKKGGKIDSSECSRRELERSREPACSWESQETLAQNWQVRWMVSVRGGTEKQRDELKSYIWDSLHQLACQPPPTLMLRTDVVI